MEIKLLSLSHTVWLPLVSQEKEYLQSWLAIESWTAAHWRQQYALSASLYIAAGWDCSTRAHKGRSRGPVSNVAAFGMFLLLNKSLH